MLEELCRSDMWNECRLVIDNAPLVRLKGLPWKREKEFDDFLIRTISDTTGMHFRFRVFHILGRRIPVGSVGVISLKMARKLSKHSLGRNTAAQNAQCGKQKPLTRCLMNLWNGSRKGETVLWTRSLRN